MYGDLRFSLRQLRRQPGLSITAIVVFALGIGASTAVFSVVYEALLRPLPYPKANRIVFLHNSFPKSPLFLTGVSSLDFAEIRRHREIFSDTGIYYFNDLTLTGAGAARHVDPVNVSASFFNVLGVKPALGRPITEADDRYGAPRVALLSDSLWRSAFGANVGILGNSIELDGEPYRIIGIMPPNFQFPYSATQLWLPMALKPAALGEMGRMDKWLQMIGRLAPGVTPEQANAALAAIGHHFAQRFPSFYPEKSDWHFTMQPLVEEQTKTIRVWVLLAFGAVLCVLLIACSNVGGLLLIRAITRNGELAVRLALGARSYQVVRQIVVETAVLTFAGCGAGILLAMWGVSLSNQYAPIIHAARIERWSLLFALTMTLLSTFTTGLLPALVSARLPLEQTLKARATYTATLAVGWRYSLAAGQIAIAVMLVLTGMLLSRSFLKLMQAPVGFAANHVWSGTVALSRKEYKTEDADLHFFQQLQERIAALPGVQSVAACTSPPFNSSGLLTINVSFPGRVETDSQSKAQGAIALPGYFETMKIPLVKGRTFTARDRGTQHLIIIDQEFARIYFPGENPIGKLVRIGGTRPLHVIGVVGNVENSEIGGPHKPEIYWLDPEELSSSMYLVARTKNDIDITPAVRNVIGKLDRNVALFDVATMNDRIAKSFRIRRFVAVLLNAFALLGLLLAALGLYGSLAYQVEVRQREIGIRLALGAARQDIARIIVAPGALVTCVGILAGIAGAILAAELVRHQLFGVRPFDAISYATVLVILVLAGCAAAWLPVRRALRVEAMNALHEE